MSYTQRLTTSLGPGQAYSQSAQVSGTLPPTSDTAEGVWASESLSASELAARVQGRVQAAFERHEREVEPSAPSCQNWFLRRQSSSLKKNLSLDQSRLLKRGKISIQMINLGNKWMDYTPLPDCLLHTHINKHVVRLADMQSNSQALFKGSFILSLTYLYPPPTPPPRPTCVSAFLKAS